MLELKMRSLSGEEVVTDSLRVVSVAVSRSDEHEEEKNCSDEHEEENPGEI